MSRRLRISEKTEEFDLGKLNRLTLNQRKLLKLLFQQGKRDEYKQGKEYHVTQARVKYSIKLKNDVSVINLAIPELITEKQQHLLYLLFKKKSFQKFNKNIPYAIMMDNACHTIVLTNDVLANRSGILFLRLEELWVIENEVVGEGGFSKAKEIIRKIELNHDDERVEFVRLEDDLIDKIIHVDNSNNSDIKQEVKFNKVIYGEGVLIQIAPKEKTREKGRNKRLDENKYDYTNHVVMPKLGEMDLNFFIKNKLSENAYDFPARVKIALNICTKLAGEGFHGRKPRPIIHNDIKPANIRINSVTLDAWFCDLGGAVEQGDGSILAYTLQYAAPETFSEGNTETPKDIYALGAVLLELFVCDDYYRDAIHKWHTDKYNIYSNKFRVYSESEDRAKTANQQLNFKYFNKRESCTYIPYAEKRRLSVLFESMLDNNPKHRPNVNEVLQFFKSVGQRLAKQQRRNYKSIRRELRKSRDDLALNFISRYKGSKLEQNLEAGKRLAVEVHKGKPSRLSYYTFNIKEIKKASSQISVKNVQKPRTKLQKLLGGHVGSLWRQYRSQTKRAQFLEAAAFVGIVLPIISISLPIMTSYLFYSAGVNTLRKIDEKLFHGPAPDCNLKC